MCVRICASKIITFLLSRVARNLYVIALMSTLEYVVKVPSVYFNNYLVKAYINLITMQTDLGGFASYASIYNNYIVNFCIAYGGKQEILEAVRKILKSKIDPKELKAAMQSLGFENKNPTIYQMIADLEKEQARLSAYLRAETGDA